MKRRSFLGKAGAGAALGAAAGSASSCAPSGDAPGVITSPSIRWRLASSYPRSLDTIYGTAERVAERVKALTNGKFTIRVFPGGELVPGLNVLDAVQKESAEMGHSASYYYIGKNPSCAFDTAIPFGMTPRQQNAWLLEGGGLELMREVFADFNVLNFAGGNTGLQMGGWFRREVGSLADLKGLKMRIPGLGGEIMSRLGVTVQVLAGGDIYPALERGAIDATEWVGPHDDQKLGFHQVAKNYYYPGWWEPGPAITFYVNRTAWGKLPPAYQAALECATREASAWMLQAYDARNPKAMKELLTQGVTMRPFADDIMTAARARSKEKIDELVEADPGFRKIHQHWSKFLSESSQWFGTAEQAYANFAFAQL